MVQRLCLGGDGVSVVVGKAGTGKTFALGAAREAWQAAGFPVLGVAVARRAALELEHDAGIKSTSVAALLHSHRPTALPDRRVLVVDEAGMVPTRQLAQLMDLVAEANGKLVLVGDHRQLPELEAGGAFRGLVNRGLAIELTENHRQRHGWERSALDHLRDGRAEQAIALYRVHGRVHVDNSPQRSCERLVADWWATGDPSGSVMLAQRRDDVSALNAHAREHMRAAGMLGTRELHLPGGVFAVGDHVLVKRNDLRLGIANGERGRVAAVDLEARELTLDCRGDRVTLDSGYLDDRTIHGDPTLLHGYAMTIHVAQGLTVDHAFVLARPGLDREAGYTALSRGRESNQLYAARDTEIDTARAEYAPTGERDADPIERLVMGLETSSASTLAIDSGEVDPLAGARHDLAQAAARRRGAERSRGSWLPSRRRQLEQLRRAEAAAATRVEDLSRQQDELRHGARPFVTDRDLDAASVRSGDRLAEIRLQRELNRERGRGLER